NNNNNNNHKFSKFGKFNKFNKSKKVLKKKVACIIWGKFDEIKQTLENLPIYRKQDNPEAISGITALQLKDNIKIKQIIDDNKYSRFDHFFWTEEKTYKYAFSGL